MKEKKSDSKYHQEEPPADPLSTQLVPYGDVLNFLSP